MYGKFGVCGGGGRGGHETTGHFEVLVWLGLCLNCTFGLFLGCNAFLNQGRISSVS